MKKIVICLLLNSSVTFAASEQDAYRAIANATYIQSGVESNVSRLEKHYERMYIDDDLKFYGGYTLAILKTISSRTLAFKWSF
jgi:hypothetical protein